jgi:hypothetical protein
MTLRANVPGQRRQITFASPPRSLNRPLHQVVSLRLLVSFS